jgi:serine/threonine protein kinase
VFLCFCVFVFLFICFYLCVILEIEKNFRKEAASLQMLGPNKYFTTYKFFFEDFNTMYLGSEYSDGGDLFSAVISNPGLMSLDNVKTYFTIIVKGVVTIHKRNIVHGDISLENIVLSNDNTDVKFCDVNCMYQHKTGLDMCKSFYGKPGNMSPEMCSGKGFKPLAQDVFSLGVLLFRMLTLFVSPFLRLDTRRDVFRRISDDRNLSKVLGSWKIDLPLDAIDLLQNMWGVETSRFTIEQVLNHKFISKEK